MMAAGSAAAATAGNTEESLVVQTLERELRVGEVSLDELKARVIAALTRGVFMFVMMLMLSAYMLITSERIFDFHAQIPYRAIELGVAQQQLNGPQVFGSTVNQGRLGPTHGMRAIGGRV